ncbi:hypothetical protein JTB14_015904 [Gonioctena quinquepunctata]|nr:hypothetical protein JTB14_015904 [Gonioctena quinquepunctata]
MLIENQQFTLKTFCDQIELLKRSINNNHINKQSATGTSQGEKRDIADTQPIAILKSPIVTDRGNTNVAPTVNYVATIPNRSSLSRNSSISRKYVSAAIHQVKTESKCRDIIQLGTNEIVPGNPEGFTLVSHRKKKKHRNNPVIVGQLDLPSDSRIKYAPKMSFLHVHKLHPETNPEDHTSILSPLFPEVKCGKLNSMYPNFNSSFEVTILESFYLAERNMGEYIFSQETGRHY